MCTWYTKTGKYLPSISINKPLALKWRTRRYWLDMLGWVYCTIKTRLDRKVRRSVWCSIRLSYVLFFHLPCLVQCVSSSGLSLSQTQRNRLSDMWPEGQLSWLLLLPVPRGGQTGWILISRSIIRAETVYHAVCSQQEDSLSNGPW